MAAVVAAVSASSIVGCGDDDGERVDSTATVSIAVTSTAFTEGSEIPTLHSCEGEDVSPPLAWSGVPEAAATLALVVDDPDAPSGTYTHWVVLDADPAVTSVAEAAVPAGGVQALNSGGVAGYAGPCPPSGTHRYRFTIYALDEPTGLADGAPLADALSAVEAQAIAQGTLTGTFSR